MEVQLNQPKPTDRQRPSIGARIRMLGEKYARHREIKQLLKDGEIEKAVKVLEGHAESRQYAIELLHKRRLRDNAIKALLAAVASDRSITAINMAVCCAKFEGDPRTRGKNEFEENVYEFLRRAAKNDGMEVATCLADYARIDGKANAAVLLGQIGHEMEIGERNVELLLESYKKVPSAPTTNYVDWVADYHEKLEWSLFEIAKNDRNSEHLIGLIAGSIRASGCMEFEEIALYEGLIIAGRDVSKIAKAMRYLNTDFYTVVMHISDLVHTLR